MKKTDLLILLGLVFSLAVFLAFSLQNVSQQNATVLENQELIKLNSRLAINASANAELAATQATEAARLAANASSTIIENQQLIKQGLNATEDLLSARTPLIEQILNISNTISEHDTQDRALLQFLRSSFNESYLVNEYRQYKQSNDTAIQLDEIIHLLNQT